MSQRAADQTRHTFPGGASHRIASACGMLPAVRRSFLQTCKPPFRKPRAGQMADRRDRRFCRWNRTSTVRTTPTSGVVQKAAAFITVPTPGRERLIQDPITPEQEITSHGESRHRACAPDRPQSRSTWNHRAQREFGSPFKFVFRTEHEFERAGRVTSHHAVKTQFWRQGATLPTLHGRRTGSHRVAALHPRFLTV